MEMSSNQKTKHKISGMMLKLKLQCLGHLMRRADSLENPAPLPQGSWKTSSVFMFLGLLPQGPGWLGVRGIFKSN